MRQAVVTVRPPSIDGVASAVGNCCNAITIAIPRVKPSITGHGTLLIIEPALMRPRIRVNSPAKKPSGIRASTPYLLTIGTNTTVIAPVGPLT